jgi:hypothetical protein
LEMVSVSLSYKAYDVFQCTDSLSESLVPHTNE